MVGDARVQIPGTDAPVALTTGMELPAGATIITGANGEVDIEPFAGGLTSVRPGTTVELEELSVDRNNAGMVTKQTATVNLRSGNVVSTLDAARRNVNNYSIRTPRGVAAARGTVYAVTVSQTGTTVATLAGTVTLTPVGGGAPIVVDIATGAIIGANGQATSQTLAELVQAEATSGSGGAAGSITNAIAQAVASVSAAVANNSVNATGASNADAGVSALAAVVRVAAQANPAAAVTFTEQAITAVTTAVGTGGNATTAVAAVTEAAVQGAVQGTIAANANNPEAASDASNTVARAITQAASTTSAQSGATVDPTAVTQAANAGAINGVTNAGVSNVETPLAPRGLPASDRPTPPSSTPITPIDVSAVSPSGNQD